MTQEEKELSFIDISGRLHYGVMVNYKENEYDHHKWKITSLYTLSYDKSGTLIDTDSDGWISYEEHEGCGMSTGSRPFRFGEVLPYLRPMSSMTEEEKIKLYQIAGFYYLSNYELLIKDEWRQFSNALSENKLFLPYPIWGDNINKVNNWLNAHHFDYRGLIEKGLALEAPERMYN